MARRIKDISYQELRTMRDDGMTLKEIQRAAGISVPTIRKILGPATHEERAAAIKRGIEYGGTGERPLAVKQKPKEQPLRPVKDIKFTVCGNVGTYHMNSSTGTIEIVSDNLCGQVTVGDMQKLIDDLGSALHTIITISNQFGR